MIYANINNISNAYKLVLITIDTWYNQIYFKLIIGQVIKYLKKLKLLFLIYHL